MQFTIDQEITLIEALVKQFPESSKRTLQQWIKAGRFSSNGSILERATQPLEPGSIVTFGNKQDHKTYRGIHILYEDRHFVVINKPEKLLSVAAEDEPRHAHHLLKQFYKTQAIFPIHRLDRDASGVMVFARGTQAVEYFDQLFETHNIEREYVAIVEGILTPDQGVWQSYLKESENLSVYTTTSSEGKLAVTHYQVYRRSKNFSYLRIKLETGRKHQIRVHCKEAGHPILGDSRYGTGCNPLKRLCLHSYHLKFNHPFTGKPLSFKAPLPKQFLLLGADVDFNLESEK